MSGANRLIDDLRNKGEEWITDRVNDFLAKRRFHTVREQVRESRDRFDHGLQHALYTLNLPSKADMESLNRKVDSISRKLQRVSSRIDRLLERNSAGE